MLNISKNQHLINTSYKRYILDGYWNPNSGQDIFSPTIYITTLEKEICIYIGKAHGDFDDMRHIEITDTIKYLYLSDDTDKNVVIASICDFIEETLMEEKYEIKTNFGCLVPETTKFSIMKEITPIIRRFLIIQDYYEITPEINEMIKESRSSLNDTTDRHKFVRTNIQKIREYDEYESNENCNFYKYG
jgi:hypothetical protein